MEDPQQLIEDCIARESRLSDWEKSFIDSIGNQLAAGRSLSAKQLEALEKIWEKVTIKS